MKIVISKLFLIILYLIPTLLFGQVVPKIEGDFYSLNFANIELKVDSKHGAKVASFKIDTTEYLVNTGKLMYGLDVFWGSTAWIGPEAENFWPACHIVDDLPYKASINGNVMSFVSQIDKDLSKNSYQMIKYYWANEQDTSINIRYSLINKSNVVIRKSIWEVTRVASEGITLWAKGEDQPWGSGKMDMSDKVEEAADFYWMNYNSDLAIEKKVFSNSSEGWYAHVNDSHQMFIKTFENVPKSNYTTIDDEIEYYVAIDHAFLELENQSRYVELNPNDTLNYEVKWYLRNIPQDIELSVGNTKLIDIARKITGIDEPTLLLDKPSVDKNKITVYPNPANP